MNSFIRYLWSWYFITETEKQLKHPLWLSDSKALELSSGVSCWERKELGPGASQRRILCLRKGNSHSTNNFQDKPETRSQDSDGSMIGRIAPWPRLITYPHPLPSTLTRPQVRASKMELGGVALGIFVCSLPSVATLSNSVSAFPSTCLFNWSIEHKQQQLYPKRSSNTSTTFRQQRRYLMYIREGLHLQPDISLISWNIQSFTFQWLSHTVQCFQIIVHIMSTLHYSWDLLNS